jgi:hypothetical protein
LLISSGADGYKCAMSNMSRSVAYQSFSHSLNAYDFYLRSISAAIFLSLVSIA